MDVEDMEDVEMVAVVKVAVMKGTIRRKDSQTNKIGVEEDVVEEEVAGQIFPTSSATNVANMVTMRRIATLTNVIIVENWVILQKIVESTKGWKKQPTWSWKMKMMEIFS